MSGTQAGLAAAARRGGLLRHRNFRLLWTGETVSAAGNSMAAIGVPLLAVQVLHSSTLAVSALTAAAYLPWLLIGLPAGAWVDRLPARPLMVACDIISALLYASLPIAAWLGMLSTWQVLITALLAGGSSVFFATAYQAILPALVAADELMEGNAKLQGSASVASVAGRSMAGLAARLAGDASALLFNAGSFLVSAVCLLRVRTPAPAARLTRPGTSLRAEIGRGVAFIASDSLLRTLTIYSALANLAYGGSIALAVVFLVRVVGFGPAAASLLLATGGLGGMLGASVARAVTRNLGSARALLIVTLGTAAFGLLIPLAGIGLRAAWYVIGSTTMASGITAGSVIISSFRQAYCPPSILGRVVASQRVAVFGAVPLGALAAGVLGTALGVRTALWILLISNALSGGVLLTRGILARRDLPGSVATTDSHEPARG